MKVAPMTLSITSFNTCGWSSSDKENHGSDLDHVARKQCVIHITKSSIEFKGKGLWSSILNDSTKLLATNENNGDSKAAQLTYSKP